MRDLDLFWLLAHDERMEPHLRAELHEGQHLAGLLEELAREPLHMRVVFLGLMPRVLNHPDARVRAAALAVVAGAEGPSAWPAMVGALDDGDPAVKISALSALHTSATEQPLRWVHALFHADPEVRRAAATGGAPVGAASYAFFLLADESIAGAIRARGVEVPPNAIPALLDFAASGVVTRDEARLWLSKIAWPQTAAWLARSHRRSPSEVHRILTARGDTDTDQADALDDLFSLFLDDDADEAVRETFFAQLETALFGVPFPLRRRVVASLLVSFRRRRWFLPRAAGICALFFPAFLTAPWVPRDVRYSSLERVYENGRRIPRINDEQVVTLVKSDLVRPRKDVLDVWALGAVLHYCRSNPYSALWGWLDVDEVISAFLTDMKRNAPFLTLLDTSSKGRKWLMALIVGKAPSRRGEVLAFLVQAAQADELFFLDAMSAETLLDCFERLARLEPTLSPRLAVNKIERVASRLAEVLDDAHLDRFFQIFLDLPDPAQSPVGLATLGGVAKRESAEAWVGRVSALPTPKLKKLLEVLPHATTVPWGKELALAHELATHVSPAIADWAAARLPSKKEAPVPARRDAEVVLLPPEVERQIVDATEAALEDALQPCLSGPHRGLTEALARRGPPPAPCRAACVALLGSHDAPDAVAVMLERYAEDDAGFRRAFAEGAISVWRSAKNLPPLGHAFLYRFEPHAFAFMEGLAAFEGGVTAGIADLLAAPSKTIRQSALAAVARVLSIWRWRDRGRLEALLDDALLDLSVDALDTELGRHAAAILMAFHDARIGLPALHARRTAVAARMTDFDDETRRVLAPWISASGLPPRARARRVHRPPPEERLLETIAALTDLDALEAHCRDKNPKVVHEATLRLVELGDEGIARLVRLLTGETRPVEWSAIADSIALWPDSPHLEALHALTRDAATDPELRFRLALGLLERGEAAELESAIAAANAESGSWFRTEDWMRLEKSGGDPLALARRLTVSPHPHAYRPAVELLLGREEEGLSNDADDEALRAFLRQGTKRIGDLRRRAAAALLRCGDVLGYPILVAEHFRGEVVEASLLVGLEPRLLEIVAHAALFAGPKLANEQKVLTLLDHEQTPREVRDALLTLLLTECQNDALRQAVVQRLARKPSRTRKLLAIADTFAWGVRVGRELTGRVFRFHMIGGRGLGYTRLSDNRIHVSPLPLLREERHGREIVEALVLHEIGHHVYHWGDEEAKVWAEAQMEGIHGLLNLVADEHLERNLRATDAAYGDRLKRLVAYAFAHSARELPVFTLFDMLQSRAFAVLTRIRLGVARNPASVRIDNGSLLSEMERTGMRFAMFVRALRMGLGKRHGDPLVAQALEMFDKSFRKGDMRSLLAISYRLREMFGSEVSIMESFGGHEALGEDGADRIIHGEGIEDDEVQREVERVLDPRRGRDGPASPGGKLILNVNPDERFDLITQIEHVPYDAARHREESRRVARHARHMRRYLADLGLSLVQRRMRLKGRRFDRSRATAVVTRRDPRMLISRETEVTSDLFLGIIIDCSGSMHGRSMERARAFGVLLADAARGLPGIDVRLFGFTDRVIYDAGNARRPAVASLNAGGGNNDAAALFHVSRVARASSRRAKLLVMISDGLPTECSVAALKALVTRLSRREGMCCAQVAVRPLAEKCFPHYVEVMEDEFDVAVRRFGNIIAGLVKKAMAA